MLGKSNAVGVDIGSHSIKVCQLKETRKGLQLHTFDTANLSPEGVVEGAVMNYGAVVERLKDLVKANKLKGKQVALSVSGHSVIIKKISLPEMTDEELNSSIIWEAEQYIPFDIKEVHVDLQVLDPKAGHGQMDVLLVAARREIVDDYVSIAREAGLVPVVMGVDTFAVQNVFEMNYGFPPNETQALINIGASMINIDIIADGVLQFTRDISMGGALLTEEIQREMGVSYEEAEHYKTGTGEVMSSSAILREVERLSENFVGPLVAEIQRSIEFFKATSIFSDLSKIYLCGGSCQIPALVPLLEQKLVIPVELINPFKNIMIDTKRFDVGLLQESASSAAVAVGLSLRRRGDK